MHSLTMVCLSNKIVNSSGENNIGAMIGQVTCQSNSGQKLLKNDFFTVYFVQLVLFKLF